MQEFINEVMRWPVIVQGALGSALFWLILLVGNYLAKYSLKHILFFTKKKRKEILTSEKLLCKGILSNDLSIMSVAITTLIFDAIRYLLHGIIALIIGYMLSNIVHIFIYIGCLFSLYYLFLAVVTVRDLPSSDDGKIRERLTEIEEALENIDVNA